MCISGFVRYAHFFITALPCLCSKKYRLCPIFSGRILQRRPSCRLYRIHTNDPRYKKASARLFQDGEIPRPKISFSPILRDGEPIVLTYTEFKILELLASNRKKIFSLDHIYNTVWKEEAVSDSAIMVHIKNLRKKLGDDSRNPKYIKTAWGRGYYVD